MGCIFLMGNIFKGHTNQLKMQRETYQVKHKSNTHSHSMNKNYELWVRCYEKKIVMFDSLPEKAKEIILKKNIDSNIN